MVQSVISKLLHLIALFGCGITCILPLLPNGPEALYSFPLSLLPAGLAASAAAERICRTCSLSRSWTHVTKGRAKGALHAQAVPDIKSDYSHHSLLIELHGKRDKWWREVSVANSPPHSRLCQIPDSLEPPQQHQKQVSSPCQTLD